MEKAWKELMKRKNMIKIVNDEYMGKKIDGGRESDTSKFFFFILISFLIFP